jgi:hypothetical protein
MWWEISSIAGLPFIHLWTTFHPSLDYLSSISGLHFIHRWTTFHPSLDYISSILGLHFSKNAYHSALEAYIHLRETTIRDNEPVPTMSAAIAKRIWD